jgi:hypothetical protein
MIKLLHIMWLIFFVILWASVYAQPTDSIPSQVHTDGIIPIQSSNPHSGFLCYMRLTIETIRHLFRLLNQRPFDIEKEIKYYTQMYKSLEYIHHKPVPNPGKGDPSDAEYIYRYALYTSYTFCNLTQLHRLEGATVGPEKLPLLTADMLTLYSDQRPRRNYYIAVSEMHQTITISFRGAYDRYDAEAILPNTVVPPHPYWFPHAPEHSLIYSGLQEAAIARMRSAIPILERAFDMFPNYRLVITGFSLGGTVAYLLGTHIALRRSHWPLAAVYTFGEPISVSGTFAEWSLSHLGAHRYVRITSSDDMATVIRSQSGQFHHPTKAVEIHFPEPFAPHYIRCTHAHMSECGHQRPCSKRSWLHHSTFGPIKMGAHCILPDYHKE